jgi:hypothetical protein
MGMRVFVRMGMRVMGVVVMRMTMRFGGLHHPILRRQAGAYNAPFR